jgi:hypothetical protein
MRRTRALTLVAVSSLAAALGACGASVDSETTASTSGTTQAGGGNTGGGSAGGSTTNGGAGQGGTTSNGGGGGVEVYPAPHPPPATVVSAGGPIMSAQKIVPVFFSGDDDATVAQIRDFLGKIQSSSYFATAGAEYGVGAATLLPEIDLAEAAATSTTDGEIEQWLQAKLQAGDGVFPAPDGNTIYVMFYPTSTTIDLVGFGTSCQAFGGYHADTMLGDGTIATYAVIPRCAAEQGFSAMDLLTTSTSHELLEAATDPEPANDPAYDELDDAHFYVELALLSEVGDLCSFSPSGYASYPDMPYKVQRIYSNQSALAGHNPCIPIPAGEVYFAAAPVLNDDVQVIGPNGPITMKGVNIDVGQSKTIDVDLFSDAPLGEWQVVAYDSNFLWGQPTNLSFSFDKDHGQNGDKLKLHIKVDSRGQDGLETFVLYSIQGQQANIIAGLVSTP